MADAIDKMALHSDFTQSLLNEVGRTNNILKILPFYSLIKMSYVLSFDATLEYPMISKSNTYWIIFGVTGSVALLSCILQFTLTARR